MQRDGQDDRPRHPRHVGGRALLRPGAAARARRHGRSSATRARSAAPTTSSTSDAAPTTRRPAARGRAGDGRLPTAGSRTRAASGVDRARSRASILRRLLRGQLASRSTDPVLGDHARATRTGQTMIVARSDRDDDRAGPLPRRRARGRVLLEFENWLAPGRYTHPPSASSAAPAPTSSPLRRGHRLARRRMARRPAASSTCPRRSRSDADERPPAGRRRSLSDLGAARRTAAAPPAPGRTGRRPSARTAAASGALTLTHRADRVQAPLLRLGARLRLVADAPADALRRPLFVFVVIARARPVPLLRRLAADRDRPLHLLRRGHQRVGHLLVVREGIVRKTRSPAW